MTDGITEALKLILDCAADVAQAPVIEITGDGDRELTVELLTALLNLERAMQQFDLVLATVRTGPFPPPASEGLPTPEDRMKTRDAWGLADQGGPTDIPWDPPAPKPGGPKDLGEVPARNIRKGFE